MSTQTDPSAADLTESVNSLPDWLEDDEDEVETTDQAPDAPVAASEGEEPKDQPQPTDGDPAQPRDDKGRFAPKSATSEEPPASGEPASPAPTDTTGLTAEPVPSDPQTPVAAPASAFTFKADGREYTLPGVTVAPESEAELRQLLSEGMHHRTTWRAREAEMRREVEQASVSAQQKSARADAIIAETTKILSDPELLAQFIEEHERQLPALLARAEQAELRAQLQQYEQRDRQSFRGEAERSMQTALTQQVSELVQAEFPGLFSDPEVAKLNGDLLAGGVEEDEDGSLALAGRVIFVAGRDYPEYGYKKGEVLVDEVKLRQRIAAEAAPKLKAAHAATAAAKKVEQVAKANAAKMAAPTAPPTVGAKHSPEPTASKRSKPTNRREYMDWLDDDDE